MCLLVSGFILERKLLAIIIITDLVNYDTKYPRLCGIISERKLPETIDIVEPLNYKMHTQDQVGKFEAGNEPLIAKLYHWTFQCP